MIIASRATSIAHTLLTEWLNRELDNRTVGFWNELSDEVHGQMLFREVTLLVMELYYANRTTMTGFVVLSNLNLKKPRMTVFNAEGEPVYYNAADTEFIINSTEDGDVVSFVVGEHIPLYDEADQAVGTVYLHLESNWGTMLPIIHAEIGGSPFGAGLLDVLYEGREAGVYKVMVEPDADAMRYYIENVSNQILDLTVPIFPNFHLPYRLLENESAYVPKTANSEHYLQELVGRNLIRMSGPVGL